MHRPEIVLISALAENNRVIGHRGKLPWYFPEDLKRFGQLTRGHSVIVGRVTWQQDLQGCPLLQRRNLVVSASGSGLPVLEVGYIRPTKPASKLLAMVQADSPDTSGFSIVPPTPGGFSWYEIHAVASLEQALALVQPEPCVFIIGGASIYQQTLPLADRLELTIVQGDYEGDAFFPEYKEFLAQQFIQTQRIERSQYRFETYIRREDCQSNDQGEG